MGWRSVVIRMISLHSQHSFDATQKLVMSNFQSLVYFCLQQLCAVIGHIAVWHPKSFFVYTARSNCSFLLMLGWQSCPKWSETELEAWALPLYWFTDISHHPSIHTAVLPVRTCCFTNKANQKKSSQILTFRRLYELTIWQFRVL